MSWLSHDQYPVLLQLLAAMRVNGQPFCWTFNLSQQTHEGRSIVGLRIQGSGRPEGELRGVLIVAGAHAREMAPPEAALCFAALLCTAYANGTGLSFGGKFYNSGIVKLLVEALEIYVVPLLNVDGRFWVETNDQNWRKNRRPGACRGADLNRNHEFLFSSGIGTSSNPCDYQIYRGPSAHSEPETSGIRDLLNAKPHIKGVLDAHSYTGLVLYPWGDDENQSSDSSMTFTNAAWDGQRGIIGDAYREFIESGDLSFYVSTAARMRDGIHEVAGRTYVAQPSVDLYPTSGTLDDYGYARHLAAPANAKAMSMTVEIGFLADGGFRPSDPWAQIIRMEGAVSIAEFCLAIMCAGDAVLSAGVAKSTAADLLELRSMIAKHGGGRRHLENLAAHSGEIVTKLSDPELATATASLVDLAVAWSRGEGEIDAPAVQRANKLIAKLSKDASVGLKIALKQAMNDLAKLQQRRVDAALRLLSGPLLKSSRKRTARPKRR